MPSVGELMPVEMARVRRCLERGVALGQPGQFYVLMCRRALAEAEQALASGDVAAIIRTYEGLKEIAE